jgi:EpsI family protein
MSVRMPATVLVAAALMVGAVPLAAQLKPTVHLADIKAKIVLVDLFPAQFGDWKELPTVRPVIPDPVGQAVIDATYSQTLARTYVNSKGEMVMLSVAYGSDQNSEATAAHRPEFCYVGNGFTVTVEGTHDVRLGEHDLRVRHMLAIRGATHEPVSYWVTLDEQATLPGFGRKLSQLRYGLRGQIADGMLMRVSSINTEHDQAYALQGRFLKELYEQVPPVFRARVFGV